MRYKFRGKRLDGQGWVYGSLVAVGGMTETYWILESDGIFKDNILPESVGQWTGLVDKNGVEIYEGDMVQGVDFCGDLILGFVEYDKGVYLVNCGDWNPALRGLNDDVEIIGNIHDNPELLAEPMITPNPWGKENCNVQHKQKRNIGTR